MTDSMLTCIRVFLDCLGVVILVFVLYVVYYFIKKYLLVRWVHKAVNAAESIYKAPKNTKEYSTTKKEWVVSFLKDNGLTAGVSDDVVDVLIESEVTELKLKDSNNSKLNDLLNSRNTPIA